jgi:hypothetical protein
MESRIKITKAEMLEISSIICLLAIFFYIVFQLPKMNEQQRIDTGAGMIIAIVFLVFFFGQLARYLENRKQRKLTHWMDEENKTGPTVLSGCIKPKIHHSGTAKT